MIKFAHIGMPKALSSALQEGFFEQHEAMHFLGAGVGSLIDYVNDDINITFETLIPYASETHYQENKAYYKQAFDQQLDAARFLGKGCVGVSSEWLGFNFTPEMADPELKIKRLADLLGADAHIIFITRNQRTLLKSLYAELVKVGYANTYADYCAYLWNYRDRSCLQDLCYDVQYERLTRYFHPEHIHVLPLESYRKLDGSLKENGSQISLISAICSALNIPYPSNFQLPRVNPSLTEAELEQKLILNRKYRHDFGNVLMEPSNRHRSRKQLERNNSIGIADYFSDVKIKRLLLEMAKSGATTVNAQSSDLYVLPRELLYDLEKVFEQSNARFTEITQMSLYNCDEMATETRIVR